MKKFFLLITIALFATNAPIFALKAKSAKLVQKQHIYSDGSTILLCYKENLDGNFAINIEYNCFAKLDIGQNTPLNTMQAFSCLENDCKDELKQLYDALNYLLEVLRQTTCNGYASFRFCLLVIPDGKEVFSKLQILHIAQDTRHNAVQIARQKHGTLTTLDNLKYFDSEDMQWEDFTQKDE